MIQYKAIVIGGSAGSFPVVIRILNSVPKNINMPLIFCLHRLKHVRNGMVEALSSISAIPVMEPNDKDPLKNGIAYIAPANYHLFVEPSHTFSLSSEEMLNYSRPAIDLTFDTASYAYREKLIAIILSGANSDGAHGMRMAKKRGAFTIVQHPDDAAIKTMPLAALKASNVNLSLTGNEIVGLIQSIAIQQNIKPIPNPSPKKENKDIKIFPFFEGPDSYRDRIGF
ncbi:MAG: chemotaxis protein CheB [Bacteroidetes bacterium]|nr:chemotaxis protein CheB [Bacteroidota bacterium]